MDFYDETPYVLVYRYRYWDAAKNRLAVSARMETLETIRNGLGTPIHGSAMKVNRFAVDEYGRYRGEYKGNCTVQ